MLTASPIRIGSDAYTKRFSTNPSPQPCTGNQPSLYANTYWNTMM
jgi:hypothetical protein